MSKVVVHGNTIYLCGQTAGETPTIEEQTSQVLAKCEQLLNAYGSDKKSILAATIYIKDMNEFARMNAVWDAWVEPGHEPARACVQAQMARENILVEIVMTAAKK